MTKPIDLSIPAKVKYIGARSNPKFTVDKVYDAFFIEYWEGERTSLHVRGDDGKITDFNPLADFLVLEDKGNVLNFCEARVKCVSDAFPDKIIGVTKGKEYPAIGRDKDGMYLVMDNSYCCYFYPPEYFEIVDDEYGILKEQSVYYSYNGSKAKRENI